MDMEVGDIGYPTSIESIADSVKANQYTASVPNEDVEQKQGLP